MQLLFSSLAVAAKLVLPYLPGRGFVAFRVLFGFLLLLAVGPALGQWQNIRWRNLPPLMFYAVFGVIANQLLFIEGLERSTATNAVIIGATIPVFTTGIAVVLRRERATRRKVLGLLLAFVGALVLVGAGAFEGGGTRLVGNLLILCNSLSYSIYLVLSPSALERYNPRTAITWIFLFGVIGTLPFGAASFITHAGSLPSQTWWVLAYVIIFPTALTYFLNIFALKYAPSSLVAMYAYLQPVFGATLAQIFLHERVGAGSLLGAIPVLMGIWLVAKEPSSQVSK